MKRPPLSILIWSLIWLAIGVGCSRSKNPEKYLIAANRFYDARQFEKAKLEYLNVLRRQPTNATAIMNLGKILYQQGQLREAFPFLLESRKRFPDDVESAQQLASVYLAGGEFDKARAELLVILQRQPTNELALTTLADTARKPQEIQSLLSQLDQTQQRFGSSPAIHVARAQLAQRRGETAAVESELLKALTTDPRSVVANQALGVFRWSQGATNQAEKAFRTAAQSALPTDPAQMRLAIFLARTEQFDEAKKTLDVVNRESPEKISAWTLRAEIALREKRYEECGNLLDRALGQAPNDPEARLLQAQLRIAQKKPDQAVRLLQGLAESLPRSAEVQYQLGIAQLLNKDVNSAVASLGRAISLDTNNITATLTLAEINLQRGQTALAITSLTDLVRRAPGLSRAQFLLGRAYIVSGRLDDAVALYQAMRTKFPQDPAVPLQLGLLLRQRKQDAEARKAFEEARRLAPGAIAPLEQLVDLNLAAGAPAQALALLQPELDRQPKSATLWLLRARIYAMERNKNGAESALEKAIELEPDNQAPYLMLADLSLKAGEPKESIKRLDELLEKKPKNTTALMLLGMINTQLGNTEESQKAYESILKIDPNFVMALNNLAYQRAKVGNRLEEAHTLALKARQLAPTNPGVADTLGWIEFQLGNYPEALRLLNEAREQLTNQPEFEVHLGLASYMMGLENEAKRAFAVALKSTTPFAERKLLEQRLDTLNLPWATLDPKTLETLEKRRQEDPRDLIALLHLGAIYEDMNDQKRARDAYDAAYKLNPMVLETLNRLAALEVDQNPSRASDLARQAQRLATDDPQVANILGRLALRSGDMTTAYGLLQSSVRQLTNQPAAWFDLANAAFGSGRLAEANDAMRNAVRLGLPPARTNAAQAFLTLLALGQNPPKAAQSVTQIEQFLKNDATNGPALYAAGIAWEQQGKFVEARDAHEKLLQQFPAFTPAVRQLAILYAEHLNNDVKAYELATKARITLTKDDILAKTLGKLAYRRGDYRYAVQLFSEVARNQPKDAELQFQLGLAYLRLKQIPDSRAALERAIALDPKGTFVSEARKILTENKSG